MNNEPTNPTTEEPATNTTPEESPDQARPTTPEPAATTPATEDDAHGKASREAKYRVRAREAEAKVAEKDQQIAQLQAQLQAQQDERDQEKAAEARAALCHDLDTKTFGKDRGIFAMMEGLPDDTLKDIAHAIDMWQWGRMNANLTGEKTEKMRKIVDGSGTGWKQAF